MTVTEFKKPVAAGRPPLSRGTVVVLNSDDAGRMMTVGDAKGGQSYCRWHDDVGVLQGDWFWPEELTVCGPESEVVFTEDFSSGK